MELNKEAMQHIEELSAAARGIETDTETPIVALPGNAKIESLEPYLKKPVRFEAAFNTRYIEEMALYANAQKGDNQIVTIDVEKMCAESVFDMGTPDTPEWGKHRAKLKLEHTEEFKALNGRTSSFAESMNQREFCNFLYDWKDIITCHTGSFDDMNDIDVIKAIQLIQKIKIGAKAESIHRDEDFSTSISIMEQMDVGSEGEALPGFFTFKCAPYYGLEERDILCQIQVKAGNKTPVITYRIMGKDRLMEEVANEFREKLTGALKDKTIYIGTLKYR